MEREFSPEPRLHRPGLIHPLDSLLRLGNFFELDFEVSPGRISRELEPFEDSWVQYNPYKPGIQRMGLSLTSLDGGITGKPDLYSLQEYYRREGVLYRESDFRVYTPVYEACRSLHPLFAHFHPHIGRSHFLRFEAGGFFPPHRDAAMMAEPDTVRILIPVLGNCRSSYVFLYDERPLYMEAGCSYFLNTLVNHSVFAFSTTMMVVCNVILNEHSLKKIKELLVQK